MLLPKSERHSLIFSLTFLQYLLSKFKILIQLKLIFDLWDTAPIAGFSTWVTRWPSPFVDILPALICPATLPSVPLPYLHESISDPLICSIILFTVATVPSSQGCTVNLHSGKAVSLNLLFESVLDILGLCFCTHILQIPQKKKKKEEKTLLGLFLEPLWIYKSV